MTKKKVLTSQPIGFDGTDKEDKSTKIIYKKLPGNMVVIIGFKNFMTRHEIRNKYGGNVDKVYIQKDFMVKNFKESNGEGFILIPTGENMMRNLYIGDVLSDDEFSKIIASVKKCGNVLHEIVAAFNTDSNVKEIKI